MPATPFFLSFLQGVCCSMRPVVWLLGSCLKYHPKWSYHTTKIYDGRSSHLKAIPLLGKCSITKSNPSIDLERGSGKYLHRSVHPLLRCLHYASLLNHCPSHPLPLPSATLQAQHRLIIHPLHCTPCSRSHLSVIEALVIDHQCLLFWSFSISGTLTTVQGDCSHLPTSKNRADVLLLPCHRPLVGLYGHVVPRRLLRSNQ